MTKRPAKIRSIQEIYDETSLVLFDGKYCLISLDELSSSYEALKGEVWKLEMEKEMLVSEVDMPSKILIKNRMQWNTLNQILKTPSCQEKMILSSGIYEKI